MWRCSVYFVAIGSLYSQQSYELSTLNTSILWMWQLKYKGSIQLAQVRTGRKGQGWTWLIFRVWFLILWSHLIICKPFSPKALFLFSVLQDLILPVLCENLKRPWSCFLDVNHVDYILKEKILISSVFWGTGNWTQDLAFAMRPLCLWAISMATLRFLMMIAVVLFLPFKPVIN